MVLPIEFPPNFPAHAFYKALADVASKTGHKIVSNAKGVRLVPQYRRPVVVRYKDEDGHHQIESPE